MHREDSAGRRGLRAASDQELLEQERAHLPVGRRGAALSEQGIRRHPALLRGHEHLPDHAARDRRAARRSAPRQPPPGLRRAPLHPRLGPRDEPRQGLPRRVHRAHRAPRLGGLRPGGERPGAPRLRAGRHGEAGAGERRRGAAGQRLRPVGRGRRRGQGRREQDLRRSAGPERQVWQPLPRAALLLLHRPRVRGPRGHRSHERPRLLRGQRVPAVRLAAAPH
mmetsp:Transcript_7873/g.23332  ORF Transcript_7873/g.23332 Transcript_7873/m.23332 type:complete len:223 (-) Transcript_7873:872-1540(-)